MHINSSPIPAIELAFGEISRRQHETPPLAAGEGRTFNMLPRVYLLGYPFPMYAIMAFFGIVFATIIALVKSKAFGLRKKDVLRLAVYVVVGALLGAKLFGAVGQVVKYGREPGFWTAEVWLHILGAGGVFYGGLLGGLGLVMLRAKLGHIELKKVLDIGAYVGLAFQSIGRLGCWCAGCCHGIELADGTRFPVQLFEAGFCFAALVVFLVVRPERRWPTPLFPAYLITYSAGRFILEFFRGDANRGVWILSTSQWIAIALIALAVVWLRKSKTTIQKKEDSLCE